jgi:D-serine dehydratase
MTFVLRNIGDDRSALSAGLLGGDFELPRLVLKRSALEHNIATMAKFCSTHGASIAPHAKTTMAPSILRRQLESGAWAMTVATMQQLRTCAESGVPRVLLANEVVNPRAAEWLGREVAARDGAFEAFCLVDSVSGVGRLSEGLRASGLERPLPVLIEVGPTGGRAGIRSVDEAVVVAQAVAASPALRLAGVEGFEGLLGSTRTVDNLAKVDEFLGRMQVVAQRLEGEGLLRDGDEVVLSAGGSTFFDRAAIVLGATGLQAPTRVVLRSGCYATHDHGSYGGSSPLAGETGQPTFVPALELWSEILSTPEPLRAIAGYGRRDAPFDSGLPVVLSRIPAGMEVHPVPVVASVTGLNDQHAYIDTTRAPELAVGDLLICGILHPCTAFDKWRKVPMVDDDYRVVEIVETLF